MPNPDSISLATVMLDPPGRMVTAWLGYVIFRGTFNQRFQQSNTVIWGPRFFGFLLLATILPNNLLAILATSPIVQFAVIACFPLASLADGIRWYRRKFPRYADTPIGAAQQEKETSHERIWDVVLAAIAASVWAFIALSQ